MNSLVEQVRAALEKKTYDEANKACVFGSHEEGWAQDRSVYFGYKAGADSRTEMICRLVEALDDIKNNDCFMPECTCRRDTAAIGLHELKKDLGLG